MLIKFDKIYIMGKRKYFFNQDYFENIDTAKKAYILGFIGADGNNSREGFRIELNSKDADILYKIKDEIGESKLEINDDKCGLWYYSIKMSNQLNTLGVMPSKTYKFDYIKTNFERDFIRGYFDGDGSIFIDENNYNRVSITITGNNLLINKIKAIIDTKFNLNGYTYCRKKKTPNIITLNYCGTPSCVSILKWLYEGSSIYLDRKFKLFKESVKIQKEKIDRVELRKQQNKSKVEKKLQKEERIKNKVITLLDEGYSIRQIKQQHGIDKRKTKRIIEEEGYQYPTRRRMFFSDPNRVD